MTSFEKVGLASAIIVAVVAFIIASTSAIGGAITRGKLDDLIDRLTPSFTEQHAAPERATYVSDADTDQFPPVPAESPRTDTQPSDVPRQLAEVALAAERDPQYREFTLADGTVHRFEVRSSRT